MLFLRGSLASLTIQLVCLASSSIQLFFGDRFLWKLIWRSRATLTLSFFFFGKHPMGVFLTCDNLQKMGEILVNRCFMCKAEVESADHLLLYCLLLELYGI